LARLNEFPVRAINPDTAKEMAFRERFKKQQEAIKERNKETKSTVAKKLKNNDSALLLKELAKKKKRGEDLDDAEIAAAKKERSEKVSQEGVSETDEDNGASVSVLPKYVKFPRSDDEFYPAEFDKTIYDCYKLRVVFDREKTGFEETKDFPIVINSIIAGRY
jgi:uncharacterized membrane protein